MPSVHPEYEYDIFVSYRQNDNRSGWVTDFVNALREELAATIKYPVSVYFDINPFDGLLETHNVDKSLEEKLRSVILLPILSQTYCDANSFAWQHEFCAFNRLSGQSKLGRDIRLGNGNVSSRILPIKIHDIDLEDKEMIESELGGMVRGIDFIYREPGVNRPLRPGDSKKDNQNKTDFGNQVNKVANAIKELLTALRNPGGSTSRQPTAKPEQKPDIAENSLAVLPFTNLSNDTSQEYFADGIMENILGQLATLPSLRVISRTSVMRYKKTTLSAPEIAMELGVQYLLEGSAQMHNQKVRIQAQLIDAEKDRPVWSRTFLEKYDDLFAIQDSVSSTVAQELLSSLSDLKQVSTEAPTINLEAYDYFLKGRHAFNQWGLHGYKEATEFFKKALVIDPEFQQAYSYLASSYSARMSWNGDLTPSEAVPLIQQNLDEAWRRGPTDNDLLTKGFLEFFVNKDIPAAVKFFSEAADRNPNNALVLYTWCYALQLDNQLEESQKLLDKAVLIEPRSIAWFNYQSIQRYLRGDYDGSLQTLQEALVLFPDVLRLYDFIARVYLTMGKFNEAIDTLQSAFKTSRMRPPSMVAYQAAAYAGLKKEKEADASLKELIVRSEKGEKGVNIYVVQVLAAQGRISDAVDWYRKAKSTNDVDLIWWKTDPLLKGVRNWFQKNTADFESAEKVINVMLENQMPQLPYHNIGHIRDVLDAALRIAATEGVPDEEVKLLRLAALLHDAGFIYGAKEHELRSAQLARELLPGFGIDNDRVERIADMIMATKLPQSPANKLEKILCDADLDYLGREDFIEIGQKLFTELLSAKVVTSLEDWNRRQVVFLTNHRYHTAFSKTNREPTKQAWLKKIAAS